MGLGIITHKSENCTNPLLFLRQNKFPKFGFSLTYSICKLIDEKMGKYLIYQRGQGRCLAENKREILTEITFISRPTRSTPLPLITLASAPRDIRLTSPTYSLSSAHRSSSSSPSGGVSYAIE